MDLLDHIRSRRSIRTFSDSPVDEDAIDRILEAGRWAPSGLNNQPWRFMTVGEGDLKDDLAQLTKYGHIIKAAPVAIIVCLNNADSYNREKDLMAVGAAVQNMLLEAHALGLGACWLGEILNRKEEAARLLGFDADTELAAVVVIGHPAETGGKGSRKPLKEFLL